ncbi:MAG: hypothetical protein HY550_02735 [Elusimicrobia bacterium]|nr:hypothetical protein [Elusimicrobiota bacterium]
MKIASAFLVLFSAAAPLAAQDRAPQLPPVDAGSILAQINQQHNIPAPQPIISAELQFALEAASELRKELKGYGIKAKVGLLNEPDGSYGLWAEFSNWADYEEVKDLFYQDPGYNPSYMGHKVYPRVPKSAEKADLNWKHVGLQAADGTKIAIDYSPLSLGGEVIAAPLWVTVADKRLTGSEKVRAVIMTYYDSSNMAAITPKEIQNLDLKFNGQAFQAEGRRVQISESHIGYGYNFRQEIAVVVDGKWLTDPVNGSHNFRFKLGWRSAGDDRSAEEKIKACRLTGYEKDLCVYKCNDGSVLKQPMQRPDPWEQWPVILCPQFVFPF